MAHKIATTIEQSKKLAEILPLESADMCYPYDRHLNKMYGDIPYVMGYKRFNEDTDFPCWSLAALLNVLPYPFLSELSNWIWKCGCYPSGICYYVAADSPIDACYEMIIKLHEQKLL